MTIVTLSGSERSLPPRLLSTDGAGCQQHPKKVYSIMEERERWERGKPFRCKILFFKDYYVIHVNLNFAVSFSFHELHLRSMQIYQNMVLHVQIDEIFRILSSGWRANVFFQVQILGTNNLFCLQNNVFVTLLHATQKLKSHFEARIFSLPQMVFIVQSKFI